MRQSVSQLIMAFEPPAAAKDRLSTLRIFHDEREYFEAGKVSVPEFKVELPHAFRETALMDAGGWRQRPRLAGPAQNLGERMWWNLPESVRDEILSGTPDAPRRVAILSASCGVDDIPWEWMNAGADNNIAANNAVRFVRLVPTLYPTPPLTVETPLRVLVVLTNPKDERLLRADEEIGIISQGLQNKSEYEVRTLVKPRIESLRTALEWSPHIVHYIGHSGISGNVGNLILHDEQEGTRWMAAAEVARYIPSSVRLLCLSTCVTAENYQTGGLAKFAHCPAEVPLPTTIVNQYAVGKSGARLFWREFYRMLINRAGNVVEAFHGARKSALEGDRDPWWCWASFSLVVRDGTGHPFRFAAANEGSHSLESTRGGGHNSDRYAAEIQAQWSARLANNIAVRMRSLDADVQKHWEKTLADEAARVESFERDIEKY